MWWYVPIFIFIIVATSFSANETDGLDGLAGGVFLTMFAAYGAIAFDQGRMDLVTFIAAIMGTLVAFLWFNIYPAKFFMGDTGSMSLGVVLGVIAMLTNTPFLLIPIGFIFVIVEIDSGNRVLGHNVDIGYFSQTRTDVLNIENTVLEAAAGQECRGQPDRCSVGEWYQ